MWQCSALLVSCVLAVVLSDTIFDAPKKSIERARSMTTEKPHRRAVSRPQINKNASREVKSVVPNRKLTEGVRETRNIFFPIEGPQFPDTFGETAPGLVVESSRLNVKVPPSRKYYNPALKKAPFPFDIPVQPPYPFQSTAFGGLYPLEVPTGSGLQHGGGLLSPTAAGLTPTAFASSIPTTSIDAVDFTSPGFVDDSWRSFQHIPVSAPSATPNFSTRPPWIPRGGKSDFKPQRGNIQTGNAPANQVNAGNTKRPSITSGNVSDLIKQVEQLIIASNQNSTNTSIRNTTFPIFRRFFKHPSVG